MDNYNLPWGSDTKDAPWNQKENPKKNFDVTISQTLSKNVTVTTSDYNLETDKDEDGYYENVDTLNTTWKEVYEDEYHTPAQLIRILKQVLEENMKNGIVFRSPGFTNDLIQECEDWCEDDYEVTQ